MLKLTKILLIAVCGLLFTACWDENLDNCKPVETTVPFTLQFIYDLNTDRVDRFSEEVEHLHLFIFDRDNRLLETMNLPVQMLDNKKRLTLSMEEGDYTVVAWGNTHSDLFRFNTEQEVGLIDQLTMSLFTGEEEQVISSAPPGIFHAAERITVSEGGVYPVSMTKNTNRINVLLTILGPNREFYTLEDLNLGVRLTGQNSVYGHDNGIMVGSPITYLPYGETKYDNNSLLVSMNTLRLTPESDLMLTIWETWRPIYPEKPADDLLLNFLLADLEVDDLADYLDRNDDWIIGVELEETVSGYVAVRFYLRDWNELKDWDVIIPPGKL